MQYFRDLNGALFAYDPTNPMDEPYIAAAVRAGWTDVTGSNPTALTLAQAQATQVAVLQAAYTAAVNQPITFTNAAGVTSTYPAGGVLAINKMTAEQNLSNVITAGESAWKMGRWLDTSNVAQTFTFADLQGLAAAMEAVQVLDWQDLIAKVAEVRAAISVEAVRAITF